MTQQRGNSGIGTLNCCERLVVTLVAMTGIAESAGRQGGVAGEDRETGGVMTCSVEKTGGSDGEEIMVCEGRPGGVAGRTGGLEVHSVATPGGKEGEEIVACEALPGGVAGRADLGGADVHPTGTPDGTEGEEIATHAGGSDSAAGDLGAHIGAEVQPVEPLDEKHGEETAASEDLPGGVAGGVCAEVKPLGEKEREDITACVGRPGGVAGRHDRGGSEVQPVAPEGEKGGDKITACASRPGGVAGKDRAKGGPEVQPAGGPEVQPRAPEGEKGGDRITACAGKPGGVAGRDRAKGGPEVQPVGGPDVGGPEVQPRVPEGANGGDRVTAFAGKPGGVAGRDRAKGGPEVQAVASEGEKGGDKITACACRPGGGDRARPRAVFQLLNISWRGRRNRGVRCGSVFAGRPVRRTGRRCRNVRSIASQELKARPIELSLLFGAEFTQNFLTRSIFFRVGKVLLFRCAKIGVQPTRWVLHRSPIPTNGTLPDRRN